MGVDRRRRERGSEHVAFCTAQIEVEIMHTECAERSSVIVRVQRIQRLQYFKYLMPPAKLCFLLAVDSLTTSRYPVKWLLSSSLAACQCLSLSHVARRRLWRWLWLRLWCNVHVVNVCCVLYHFPCNIIQRPQGRKRRKGVAWQGGGGPAAAFNVRSWQWNNIKLCLYICNAAAVEEEDAVLLLLQLFVPLERLDVCNLPAQRILH